MPRRQRRGPERRNNRRPLERMTRSELLAIKYFGCIHRDPYTVTFRATKEEQEEATRILRERDLAATDDDTPPAA